MTEKFGRDDGDTEDVDLSGVVRRSGMTFYGSTKIEKTAGGYREQFYGNCTFNPPAGKYTIEQALNIWTQTHQEVLTRSWSRARERIASIEGGHDVLEQFEYDAITGEILE